MLEKLVGDKHSSLLRKFVNFGQKGFIILTPGLNCRVMLFCPLSEEPPFAGIQVSPLTSSASGPW